MFPVDWLRPSPRSNTEAYCIYCDRHLKANRKSLLNHTQSKHHLSSLPEDKKRRRGRPKAHQLANRFAIEPAIIPDDDPLYDAEHPEDGEIYDDGSMPGTSFVHDDDENDGDMNFMVTEVDPPDLGSDDEEEDDDDYGHNGTGFSVPSHIANGSAVCFSLIFIFFSRFLIH